MPNKIAMWLVGTSRSLAILLVCVSTLLCGTEAATAQPESPVTVTASANMWRVAPGGQLVIAVLMDHEPEWHSHTNDPVIPRSWGEFDAKPTVVHIAKAERARIGPIQWPTPHTVLIDLAGTGRPEKYGVFEGRTIIFVPVLVDVQATGSVRVDIEVSYQTCNDTTCLRLKTQRVGIEVPIGTEQQPAANGFDFKTFDDAVFAKVNEFHAVSQAVVPPGQAAVPATSGKASSTFFGIPFPHGGGIAAIAAIFALAAVGGLILNLTPCVLPVIPLKIMALTQHAKSPGRTLYLGSWMSAGVVAFWIGIGVPAMLLATWSDPSQVFALWWVTFGMGVLIAVMAMGMLGLFQFTLPQGVYMINPKADSPGGSFVFGVMTAVLGLPCFGFIAGALLAATATLPKLATLTVYAGIGVGMAIPYFVLAMKPKWGEKIPRTGPASDLVKQVMGLLLFAASAFFVGSGLIGLVANQPWMGRLLHWWAVAGCGVIAAVWLIYRTFQITQSSAKRSLWTVVGVSLAGIGVWVVADLTAEAKHSQWVDYTPSAFEKARRENKVVVVDFTAEWCINCQVLKNQVLSKEPAKSALAQGDVVLFVVDFTGENPAGEALQKELGRTGIPLLAVYTPGSESPWLANAYTGTQVVQAVEAARKGAPVASRGP